MDDSANAAPNLRQRKKDATRLKIQHAAFELAYEHGPDSITVEMITAKADISQRTFFNYFESKDDALLADEPHTAEELMLAIAYRPRKEAPIVAVKKALHEYIISKKSSANRAEVLKRYRLIYKSPVLNVRLVAKFSALEKAIAEAVIARLGNSKQNDDYAWDLAALSVTLLRLSFTRWARNGADLEKEFERLFKQLEKGL